MKKFLWGLFLVGLLMFPAISSAAGYTTVTATVKDPNGLAYVNCAFNVSFLNQSTAPVQPLLNGSPFQQVYSGQSCDNTGAFTIVLPDNNVITPTPSKWTFSVCASDGKTCFSTSITITGASQSITATLQAAAVVLPFSLQTIGGTGISGQVTFWSGTNSLSGDNNLFWDNTNKRLGIGTNNPVRTLEAVTSTSGVTNDIFSGRTTSVGRGFLFGLDTVNNKIYWRLNDAGDYGFQLQSSSGASSLLTILNNGNLGVLTTSPTNMFSLDGQVARTIWMERQLTVATPGNNLTVQASGAVVGGTNLAGGALNLSGGTSTGTGTSIINFNTSSTGVSGTTDNAPTTKISIDGVGNLFPAVAGTMSLGKSNLPFTTLFWSGSSSTPTTNNFTFAGTATAARTWTFQDASDTLVGRATTDTFTNKTFDTAGVGNIFRISGTQISSVTGTGSAVLATSPALVTPTFGGGTTLTKYSRFSLALSPVAVAANTCASQTFTVTGVAAADILIAVSKPTEQAGLAVTPGHVTLANTLTVNFCNVTAAAITPTAAETYQFVLVQ